jgi:hypothetical protein
MLIFTCRWKSSPTRARLRDQVPVGAVQLDAVEARLTRAPRALGEGRDGLADLRGGHRLGLEAVRRVGPLRGAEPHGILDALQVALPSRVTELEDEAAVEPVHRLTHGTPERDVAVVSIIA